MTTVEPITAEPPEWQRRPVLRQQWAELAYFHWRYEPESVQRLLPAGLDVDTFDGSAWVGLIPFEMRNVQVGPTPPVPWLGSFIEINVRTYVVDGSGRRAVWFFSLDVPRAAIVGTARSVFALPYCWSRTEHRRDGQRHRYRMDRRWPRSRDVFADMAFTVADPIDGHRETDLDRFLTARWALMTRRRRRLRYGAVWHPRWPLYEVTGVEIDQSVVQAAGLPVPDGAPHALYSPGVDVRVAWLEKVPEQEVP